MVERPPVRARLPKEEREQVVVDRALASAHHLSGHQQRLGKLGYALDHPARRFRLETLERHVPPKPCLPELLDHDHAGLVQGPPLAGNAYGTWLRTSLGALEVTFGEPLVDAPSRNRSVS